VYTLTPLYVVLRFKKKKKKKKQRKLMLLLFVCLFFICVGGSPDSGKVAAYRIVNGLTVATTTILPFHCGMYDSQSGLFLCGCSLISSSWILTAGSCVRTIQTSANVNRDAISLRAVFGSTTLSSAARVLSVTRVLIHQSWSYAVTPSDRVNLAWMQLSGPVFSSFTDSIRPVLLLTLSDSALYSSAGTSAFVAGWGSTSATAGTPVFPDQLMVVSAPLQTASSCNALLNVSSFAPISSFELCAGDFASGPCVGDAGGALFATAGGTALQIGVVSGLTSAAVCGSGTLGVFTQIAPFRDFIQSTIDEPLYNGNEANVFGVSLLLLLVVAVVL
jgi:secreted trypsin-like serine protease